METVIVVGILAAGVLWVLFWRSAAKRLDAVLEEFNHEKDRLL